MYSLIDAIRFKNPFIVNKILNSSRRQTISMNDIYKAKVYCQNTNNDQKIIEILQKELNKKF